MTRTCPGCGFALPEGARHHQCAVCGVLRLTELRCICVAPVPDRKALIADGLLNSDSEIENSRGQKRPRTYKPRVTTPAAGLCPDAVRSRLRRMGLLPRRAA
jgi:hypothetical protein